MKLRYIILGWIVLALVYWPAAMILMIVGSIALRLFFWSSVLRWARENW